MRLHGNHVNARSWLCYWLFLQYFCGVSLLVGGELKLKDQASATGDRLATQVDEISESQRVLAEQLARVLRENDQLSQRLDALLPPAPAAAASVGESDMPPLLSQSPTETPVDPAPLDSGVPSASGVSGCSAVGEPPYGLKSLFDSLHSPGVGKSKPWYEKMTIRGYTQIRFGRAISRDPQGGAASLFGDHSISDETGTFSVRRARLILSEEVSDHLLLYFQSDFANNPADGTSTFFAQIRDLYADIYIDTAKVNRLRVGQSKLPWGFEEMQSSGLRIPLDRSDAIDSGDSPNQRDLGVFYYWTPVDKQKLLKELVEGGLKGSGNYGIFGFGVYNGQGGSELDENRSLHAVARLTWPFQLASGQAVEMSIQGYTGKEVVGGTAIYPLGQGPAITPAGVGYDGLRDQRIAGTFVWYPQPFGFQAEWNVGEGPGLNNAQTEVQVRALSGGYAMATYKLDTPRNGIFIPYARYQHYRGGYRSIANAPYGTHDEYSFGLEWQIRKELELVVEYGIVNGVSLVASAEPGTESYQNFKGQLLRSQLQINY